MGICSKMPLTTALIFTADVSFLVRAEISAGVGGDTGEGDNGVGDDDEEDDDDDWLLDEDDDEEENTEDIFCPACAAAARNCCNVIKPLFLSGLILKFCVDVFVFICSTAFFALIFSNNAFAFACLADGAGVDGGGEPIQRWTSG